MAPKTVTETPAVANANAEQAQDTVPAEASSSAQPLSKNAQKRLAKAVRIAEQKKERRAAEKERKKEKRRILAQKRDAGELDGEELARVTKKRKTGEGPRVPFGACVVVDLGFDDMMTENEVKSLTAQLAYTYSANRKAERPIAHLLFTSLDGRTKTRMDAMSNAAYKRWANSEFWQDGYEKLWEGGADVDAETSETAENAGDDAAVQDAEPTTNGGDVKKGRRPPTTASKESVVYLTADSEEELTELREDETYIIGGIVDHNRYKNFCLNKSRTAGIRSARLPIGTYLSELRTRKVLTVNQTFEILLKWIETRDWEKALWAVIPQRKFHEGRKRGKDKIEKGGNDENADNEDDESELTSEVVLDARALEGDDAMDDVGGDDASNDAQESAEI